MSTASHPDTRTATSIVSVVIPAYNEGPQLGVRLETLARFLRDDPLHNYEIVVVDDGSEDETFAVVSSLSHVHTAVRAVKHETNRGLGAAIRTGFKHARGEVAVTYDSDMSYAPTVIFDLVAEIERAKADLVLASPYMRGGSVSNVPWLRRVLSREANRFLSFATNGRYATITCMVRAYRMAFFEGFELTEDRMEINPELLFKAIRRGAVIAEIPSRLEWSSDRARSRSRLRLGRTATQIGRTIRYGVRHRPAVLLALPGILPGVLPLIVAVSFAMHLSLKTIAIITLVTMVIQNSSLALFAGQLALFGRNIVRRRAYPALRKEP